MRAGDKLLAMFKSFNPLRSMIDRPEIEDNAEASHIAVRDEEEWLINLYISPDAVLRPKNRYRDHHRNVMRVHISTRAVAATGPAKCMTSDGSALCPLLGNDITKACQIFYNWSVDITKLSASKNDNCIVAYKELVISTNKGSLVIRGRSSDKSCGEFVQVRISFQDVVSFDYGEVVSIFNVIQDSRDHIFLKMEWLDRMPGKLDIDRGLNLYIRNQDSSNRTTLIPATCITSREHFQHACNWDIETPTCQFHVADASRQLVYEHDNTNSLTTFGMYLGIGSSIDS